MASTKKNKLSDWRIAGGAVALAILFFVIIALVAGIPPGQLLATTLTQVYGWVLFFATGISLFVLGKKLNLV